MYKQRIAGLLFVFIILFLQSACWSSKEIEDLSIYSGLALDKGSPGPIEQQFEKQGGGYLKHNKFTATVQIIPEQMNSKAENKSKSGNKSGAPQPNFFNMAGTGDSLIEIFRQFSIRKNRPLIGHHLKVIVMSDELLQQEKIRRMMDFVLRDNDIRPSCLVFLSEGRAEETLSTTQTEEIPSVVISEMVHNKFRTSKVMKGITLSKLDSLMYSKQSFVLQNIIESNGEVEFSGAGIIKGNTGHWIGNLNQSDVESIDWIKGEVKGGTIKAYEQSDSITYEIKTSKSKITVKQTDSDKIALHVSIESTGRLSENWVGDVDYLEAENYKKLEKIFEQRLTQRIDSLIYKMQSTHKVDVAGFGDWLSIHKPHYWKKIKDHWDEEFSKTPVTFDVKLTITDFGSYTD